MDEQGDVKCRYEGLNSIGQKKIPEFLIDYSPKYLSSVSTPKKTHKYHMIEGSTECLWIV